MCIGEDIRDDLLGELGLGFLIVGIDVSTYQPDLCWMSEELT